MSLERYLKSSGWVTLAAALVVSALPLEIAAQDAESSESGAPIDYRPIQREMLAQQRAARQAEQVERNVEQRAARVERRNAQQVEQVDRGDAPVDWRPVQREMLARQRAEARQAEQVERNVQQRSARVDRRNAQPAEQVDRGDAPVDWRPVQREMLARQRAEARQAEEAEQQARQLERRERRAGEAQRNGTYASQDRNRTYRDDGRDRQWRDNDRRGDNRRWDRRWRDNDRYAWQRYRNSNRVVFRLGTYYSPYRNYSYRRYGIGSVLGSMFYSQSYWINDPWRYRLPEVYGPYRWVRYYDDALLVDVYSGQVVDVIYDVFW